MEFLIGKGRLGMNFLGVSSLTGCTYGYSKTE
jgi:hypothetical protein